MVAWRLEFLFSCSTRSLVRYRAENLNRNSTFLRSHVSFSIYQTSWRRSNYHRKRFEKLMFEAIALRRSEVYCDTLARPMACALTFKERMSFCGSETTISNAAECFWSPWSCFSSTYSLSALPILRLPLGFRLCFLLHATSVSVLSPLSLWERRLSLGLVPQKNRSFSFVPATVNPSPQKTIYENNREQSEFEVFH